MARGADLFVVCKNCGSEVSPYVTECPYCGQRVRKRAPKIERGGGIHEPPKPPRGRRRQRSAGSATRERTVRIGSRVDGKPVATIALVLASFLAYLVAVAGAYSVLDAIVIGPLDGEWWRLVTANFVHLSGGSLVFALGAYQFATMIAIGIFGSALERRHGPLVMLAVALVAGAGGMAAAVAIETVPLAAGANGMALGLLAAWAVPDLLAWRRDEEWDGDLLGTAVIAAVLLLMPAVVEVANAIVGVTGAVIGLLLGLLLARVARR